MTAATEARSARSVTCRTNFQRARRSRTRVLTAHARDVTSWVAAEQVERVQQHVPDGRSAMHHLCQYMLTWRQPVGEVLNVRAQEETAVTVVVLARNLRGRERFAVGIYTWKARRACTGHGSAGKAI